MHSSSQPWMTVGPRVRLDCSWSGTDVNVSRPAESNSRNPKVTTVSLWNGHSGSLAPMGNSTSVPSATRAAGALDSFVSDLNADVTYEKRSVKLSSFSAYMLVVLELHAFSRQSKVATISGRSYSKYSSSMIPTLVSETMSNASRVSNYLVSSA